MKIFIVVFIFSYALKSAISDPATECQSSLQNCYDSKIVAIESLLVSGDISRFGDACVLYSDALKCMDNLPCEESDKFTDKKEELTKKLYTDVAVGCQPNGEIDDCFYKLLYCGMTYHAAEEDLRKNNTVAGCLGVATFDKCVKDARETCPDAAMKDVYADWKALNEAAHREGCTVSCNEAMEECTFELRSLNPSDKEEYCSALKDTKGCLELTQRNIGCNDTDTQNYLKEAIQQKASKYEALCDGVSPSIQVSLFVILLAVVVSLFSRISK